MKKILFCIGLLLALIPNISSASVVLKYDPASTATSPSLGGGQGLHTGKPSSTVTIANTGYLVLRLVGSLSCVSPYLNYRQYTSLPYSGPGAIITNLSAITSVTQGSTNYAVITFSSKPTFNSADFYQADVGGSGGVCATTLAVGTNFPDTANASDTVACISDNTSASGAVNDCFPPVANPLLMFFQWIF